MLSLRHPAYRSTQFLGLLVAVNIITLFLVFFLKAGQNTLLWAAKDTYVLPPGEDELTQDEVNTKVVTVTAHSTTTGPADRFSRVPGPDFCNSCSPDDAMCTKYGCVLTCYSKMFVESKSLNVAHIIWPVLVSMKAPMHASVV
jgi:hypothetical protein